MKTIKNIKKMKDLIGKDVYYVRTCKDMPKKTDGDYYTSTGYYCVYDDYCPWQEIAKEMCEKCEKCTTDPWDAYSGECCLNDLGSCERNETRYNIFEDMITGINITEICEVVLLERNGAADIEEIDDTLFFTREKAEKRLAELRKDGE